METLHPGWSCNLGLGPSFGFPTDFGVSNSMPPHSMGPLHGEGDSSQLGFSFFSGPLFPSLQTCYFHLPKEKHEPSHMEEKFADGCKLIYTVSSLLILSEFMSRGQ